MIFYFEGNVNFLMLSPLSLSLSLSISSLKIYLPRSLCLSLFEQTDALLLTADLEEERNVGCDCNSIPFAPRSSSPSLRSTVRVCVRPARAELGGLYSLSHSL